MLVMRNAGWCASYYINDWPEKKMKKTWPIILLCLVSGALAGCEDLRQAGEPRYYWKREKVTQYAVNGKPVTLESDKALKSPPKNSHGGVVSTLPGVTFGPAIETVLPIDAARAIPEENRKHFDSLVEIRPALSAPGADVKPPAQTPGVRATLLKSADGDWNRELFYALGENGKVYLTVDGPKTIVIMAMMSINRDEALDNWRKMIYAIDENKTVVKQVSAYINRRKDVLFYDVNSESASTPDIYVLKVPEGGHVYTFRYVYSDGGDILLKFFEAVYK